MVLEASRGAHEPQGGVSRFLRRTVAVLLLLALALLAHALSNVLLVVFGAALVAVVLRAAASPLIRWTAIPQGLAVLIALGVIVALVAGGAWLFGRQLGGELERLRSQLPEAVSHLEQQLRSTPVGDRLVDAVRDAGSGENAGGVMPRLLGLGSSFASALSDGLIGVVAGIYLALKPDKYRDGVTRLFPRSRADEIGTALDNAGHALRLWLLGQLISMAVVGVLTGIGLALVGVPSAIGLGVLAGVLEFIPLIGPIISAIPGLALAGLQGSETMLWALLVYVGVQQVESNLLTPLVEKRAVSLPPALTLIGVLSMGVLFGPVGVVLAAPLVVTLFVLVQQLYVRDTLGYQIRISGQKPAAR